MKIFLLFFLLVFFSCGENESFFSENSFPSKNPQEEGVVNTVPDNPITGQVPSTDNENKTSQDEANESEVPSWVTNQTIDAYEPPSISNLKVEVNDFGISSHGKIFAPGVTEGSGWYDASKNYNGGAEKGDSALCWAFSAANMIQWWLDDYKEFTGKDYVFAKGKTIPKESKYGYHAPVMDCFREAFYNEGWLPWRGLEWFFRGRVWLEGAGLS